METAGAGVSFEDGLPNRLDSRAVEDVQLFGRSADEILVNYE